MTKTELAKKVKEVAELKNDKIAVNVVDKVLEAIATALQEGEKVQLIGFGTFEIRERAERKGRNPQTGEEMTIGATRVPAFKPGKALKDAVCQ